MGLDQEIKDRSAEVRSDGYPMSIGELLNLYNDDELDIHPEFQRFYRWSPEQKSRLIESILLGIPLPSIFVSQREDGVWDVVDGLQRLSTIFELVGVLKDEDDNTLPPLTLTKTKYLPSLEGMKWKSDDKEESIGRTNQLIIRRSKIDVKIILRESSEDTKYELFQRLNTGGSQLSGQELRNVVLMMVNPDAYRWIADLARYKNFQACIPLSDRLKSQQYDLELVTRFVVFRRLEQTSLSSVGDLGEFLTDRITALAKSKALKKTFSIEKEAFEFTFDRLASSLGEDSFRRYDVERKAYRGPFIISAFEPIAMGLGYNFEAYTKNGKTKIPNIKKISKALWDNSEFNSGSGRNASSRIQTNIPLGRRIFAP
ncbi:MAG: DUF262 domain-containing protein [Chloroflexi bacterium]|nr:DUF262 domain-containing protein [Chloroflexota bacterium]